MSRTKIVIIGGGFAGLNVAKGLKSANADVLLLDRTNHHLFQPLLYQVATATLSPRDIAAPLRSILRDQPNLKIEMAEVATIDKDHKIIHLSDGVQHTYDYLVIAVGSRHSYFGHPEWEAIAPGLKTLQDAVRIREKILSSLEIAERVEDKEEQRQYLTYVIVGGGPTGVEMAGAIAEIAKKSIKDEFKTFDISETRIILVEGATRVLMPYPEKLSDIAKNNLEDMGVEVRLNSIVTDVQADGIRIGEEWIPTKTIIWAAGNMASPMLKTLDVPLDRMGRVEVGADLTINGYPDIMVIGDCSMSINKRTHAPLPGIGPVAMQQGHYAAAALLRRLDKKSVPSFQYFDKGTMATIGNARAVAVVFGLRFSGLIAWILWSLIHVAYLIGFRNKVVVMLEWGWSMLSTKRSVRLIAHSKN
ncbi:NAD(P)/FAD-dependent oxidoreductase [bacterium]|nr:NAD(P)/FAD-dependent oxidoreductase [bacterium]